MAAAAYLGVPPRTLAADLASGKTLASIAQSQRKSVSGLEGAMLADAKKQLDAAVTAGRLPKRMEVKLEADLPQRIDDFVQHGFRFHRMGAWGDGVGRPPPSVKPPTGAGLQTQSIPPLGA